MKITVKRIVATLLVAVMLVCAAPLSGFVGIELPDLFHSASAAEETGSTILGTIDENLTWLIDKRSKTLTIDCIGDMPSVNQGNTPWYLYRKYFNKVIINDDCTAIGNYAFYECDNILSVHIPESVRRIGYSAFGYCKGLTKVTLPSKLTYMESSVFFECVNLTTVLIPDSVTNIGHDVFYNCYNLENIDIPSNVTYIGGNAFYNCRSLTNVTISENVHTIEYGAFANCDGIGSVVIPAGVLNIGDNAFTSPTQIICYKNSPAHTFAEKHSLAYWLLDDETQERIISGEIGTKLKWTIDRKERTLTIDNQGSMVSFASEDAPWKQHRQYINTVKVNDGCTNISQYAFNECSYIVSVDLPDSVETIDDCAFNHCRALRNITLPINTTSIGHSAFNYCTSLKNVYNLKNVTSIGNSAFSECYNLTSAEFNTSELSIGYSAFFNCQSLTGIAFDCSNLSIGSEAFCYCDAITEVSIKASTLSMDSGAFRDCDSLKTVSVDCDVSDEHHNYISYSTFSDCENLESVVISEGIDAIYSDAFTNCPNLSKIVIYNKNCSISGKSISVYATIYGFTGSTAEEYANNYGYRFVSIDAVCEHSYTNDCDTTCDICDQVRETNGHNYSEWTVTIEPTCNADGLKTRTCSVCGDNNEESIPAVEHEWGDWSVIKEASCSKSGLEERTCSLCGDIEKEIVEKTAHTDENGDGICEVCKKQFEINSSMSGICGPNLTWTLDDEGTLRIDGTGGMFDFKDSYIWVRDEAYFEDDYKETTTKYTSIDYTYTTTGTTCVEDYEDPTDPRLTSTTSTTWATTTEWLTTQEWPTTTAAWDDSCVATTGAVTQPANPIIPHSNTTRPTTTKSYTTETDYPISTTRYPTTCRTTTEIPTVATTKNTTTATKPTTTKYYTTTTTEPTTTTTAKPTSTTTKPTTTTMVCPESTTKEYTTGRYSQVYWYDEYEQKDGYIRVFRWNNHIDKIKKVVISEGVTSIGTNAFADCVNLTEVEMPDSLNYIGQQAFCNCSALEKLEIPRNVCGIESLAFRNCSLLKTLNYNAERVKDYSDKAFSEINITTLNIGANVNYIPRFNSVETVTFAEGATLVPYEAFSGCSELISVTLPDSMQHIGSYAFQYCSSLENIIIPENVTEIGYSAFYGCSALSEVTFNASDCRIYYNAFYECPVKTLNVGANVSNFPNLPTIENVNLAEGVSVIPNSAFMDCIYLKNVDIPESVTSIGSYAFNNCSSLTSIDIPENVTYIGENAFEGCAGLTEIVLPEGITRIEYSTFRLCSSLASFTIPENVTDICDYAFDGCTSLTEITIPENVCNIGYFAFGECTSLSEITFNAEYCYNGYNAFTDCSAKTLNVGANVNYIPTIPSIETVNFADGAVMVPWHAFTGYSNLKNVNLPDSVESIGDMAFELCQNLESINLPKNLKTIGDNAFFACYNLKTADLPDSLESIGNCAFDNCQALENIEIPDSVTYIGNYAFYGCISAESVEIPENVADIGYAAFGSCFALESVEFNAVNCAIGSNDIFCGSNNISSVEFGSEVTVIPSLFMNYKSKLTSVDIPPSVREIGESAFNGTSLSGIDLPNGIETIGRSAFANITTAKTITIPESVAVIGRYAFRNTTAVEKINFNAVNANEYTYYYGDVFVNSGTEGNGIDLIFGNSVEAVPGYMFESGSEMSYPNIRNIVIGSNVRSIGDCAFRQCCSIESVDFGNLVETIGYSAFRDCINLKELNLPESIKTVFDYAFSSCNGLTEITVPEGTEYIGHEAFSWCSGIETVNYNAVNCDVSNAFYDCENLRTVNIGNNVRYIPSYLITNCRNLERVYIPDIVIQIEPNAFYNCGDFAIVCKNGSYANVHAVQNGMKYILEDNATGTAFEIRNGMLLGYSGTARNVVLPSDIGSVGIDAFNGNDIVKSIEVPYNVSKIYTGAFANCPNLERVIIPFTVTDISQSAFTGTDATIYCYYNSYAYGYAVANNIDYELITVTLSAESLVMTAGETVEVKAVPNVTLASGVPVLWNSSNYAVASVDAEGKITANSAGNATIGICSLNGSLLDECIVTVSERTVIEFEEISTDTLKYGEKIILHVNTASLPDGTSLKWTTSNGNILSVSNENAVCTRHADCMTCTVESVGNGSAEIKATVVDKSGKPIVQNGEEITASCRMNSKGGFFQRIISFFKKLFGTLKTYPQFFKNLI